LYTELLQHIEEFDLLTSCFAIPDLLDIAQDGAIPDSRVGFEKHTWTGIHGPTFLGRNF
jgi:hypothetical protein